MPEARPPSSGLALEIAVWSKGMNARDMPSAASSEAGRTSAQKVPSARMNESQYRPPASRARPVTVIALAPKRAMSLGARATIPTMMSSVIGTSAAPEGNAEKPSTCCR